MRVARRRRRSRLRIADSIGESWLEVTRRPGRAIMTGLGVALSAAAIVTTLTLAATIRFQVSDQFDARRATQVELRTRSDDVGSQVAHEFPPPPQAIERVEGLSGVEGVAVIRETFEDQRVAINQVADPTAASPRIRVYGLNATGLRALEARVTGPGWDQWHDDTAQRVVVLSRATAAAIGAGDLAVGDRLFIAGLGFTVSGILDEAPRLPALTNGLIVPIGTVALFDLDTDRDRLIVVTAPGAARQVAAVLSRAVTPNSPDTWTAYAPEDESTLRRTVDDQLQALSLGLGAAVLVLGVVSIGNATLTSVMQRIHEIGLRRALGARPRHIATHILLDAAVIGTIGGIIGATLGLTATLAVTAAQGWVPVIDPRIPVGTIAGGILAGVVAGVYPARVGSRLQPTEALRRE
jgi:putative ABC transport system permease protein